jgi:C1A family cysteine protease
VLVSCATVVAAHAVAATAAARQPDPLPATFDLRDVAGQSYVTSVKSQLGGTCWTFGTMASLESNLLVTGAWAAAGESGEPDLAEYHLDWWNGFNEHHNGDLVPPDGSGLVVHEGGDFLVAAAYLARGEGAVRNLDAQSYTTPPAQADTSYHTFQVRDVAWFSVDAAGGMERIKRSLMEHGAVSACMTYNGAYMSPEFVHYQPPSSGELPNHAIAIIGWDDDKVTQAPEPGAWLCKNSYGPSWGLDGFFWIAYGDKHCGRHPTMGAVAFRDVVPLAFDHAYHHDYHGWRDTKTDCSEAFNAFVAGDDELLEALSFYAAADSVAYTLTVYDSFAGGMLSGPRVTSSGIAAHVGLHTVALDPPLDLAAGDDFYVELVLAHGGQPYDRTSEVSTLLGASYRAIVPSTAQPGQSYYRSGGAWLDLYALDPSANFCIKALTSDTGLRVVPATDLEATGPVGGPFEPDRQDYRIVNTGETDAVFEVACPTPWLTLAGAQSGVLPPGGASDLTIALNATAAQLEPGAHVATVRVTNLSTGLGNTERRAILAIGDPVRQHAWPLDTDPGWQTVGQWAFGVPAGGGGELGAPDPTAGHTGTQVYGYNLAGDYSNNLPALHLTTPPIDCSALHRVELRFWRWLGVEAPEHDLATIELSTDGFTWQRVWSNRSEHPGGAWIEDAIDLSAVADGEAAVRLRWGMGPTDPIGRYCGWNLDDIEIWGYLDQGTTALADGGGVPEPDGSAAGRVTLAVAGPNPAASFLDVRFTLPVAAPVELAVFDVTGRLVARPLSARRTAGLHRVVWNGRDLHGGRPASGVYFLRLDADGVRAVRKVALIR